MAYGNWGAFVYKNDERMHNWEDQTPYKENELEAGYHQAFGRNDGINPHHAVLGEGKVRLCGYKTTPVLFVDGKEIDLEEYATSYEDAEKEWADGWEGEVEGFKFKADQCDNKLELELTTPDGNKWRSTCGYCMGAGHED